MRTKCNKFALIPFFCSDCHNLIWLQKYRVYHSMYYKKKLCENCNKKYGITTKKKLRRKQ